MAVQGVWCTPPVGAVGIMEMGTAIRSALGHPSDCTKEACVIFQHTIQSHSYSANVNNGGPCCLLSLHHEYADCSLSFSIMSQEGNRSQEFKRIEVGRGGGVVEQ